MASIRKILSAIVALGVFGFAAYVFAVFLNPQGQNGLIASGVMIAVAALLSFILYRYLSRPGNRVSNEDGDMDPGAIGLGLTGASVTSRRRRDDDADPDSMGGRHRENGDQDGDGDGDLGEIG